MFDKSNIAKRVVHLFVYSLLCIPVCPQTYNSIEDEVLKLLCKEEFSTRLQRKSARSFFANPAIDESLSVFTIDNDKGFAFICEQDNENIVIAYSKDSQLDVNNLPPAFMAWMEMYNEESTYSHATLPKHSDVTPLLGNTKWGQGSPYNRQCPIYNGSTSATGCVATAMAQVMRYYQYPEAGNGTIDYYTNSHHIHVVRDLAAYPFHWQKMKDEYGNKTSEEEGNTVASLMASCGASVFMDYSPDASGAYQHDIVRGYVRNFAYDVDCAYVEREYFSNTEWHFMLQDELAHGRPVNYGGSSKADGGHSFVFDGFTYNNSTTPYYHVNWGWNGNCDGYYLIADLRPMDNGAPAVNQGFSSNQSMVIGVQPSNETVDRENVLCASQISLSSQNVCVGKSLILHAIGITNCSYRSYNGELLVHMANAIGDTLLIGRKSLPKMGFMERGIDTDISLTIPEVAMLGKYDILISTTRGDKLHSPSTLSLTIANQDGGDGGDESVVSDAELSVSELEVIQSENGIATIKAYEVFNNSIDEFSGQLYLGMSSWDGELQMLADSIRVDFIDSYSIFDDPIAFRINVSDISLQNGIYDLKVYSKSGDIFVPLLLWEQDGSTRIMKPLILTIIVKENCISIDGVEFEKEPSGIDSIINDREKIPTLYNLSGIVIKRNISNRIVIKNKKKFILKL